jgi:hypothetical protein
MVLSKQKKDMKKRFKLFSIVAMITLIAVSAICGEAAKSYEFIAIIPLATQKSVFLNQLKSEYEAIDTWLNEAQDLSSFVTNAQQLKFPEGGADPAVYVDRTTDVDSVEPTETVNSVDLKIYDSQNYKLRNIFLHALSFDKIQFYTNKSANAIRKKEIADAAYALAPDAVGAKKIIIPTTGDTRGLYKSLRLEDIITLARSCDNANFPATGRNLVLPSDMWWDLVNNNDILKGQLSNQANTGTIKPLIVEYYGFKIHKSEMDLTLAYDISDAEKAPQGTAIAGDVVPCGFMFINTEAFRAGGAFEMFYQDKSTNPTGRAYEFGFQHRFITGQQFSGGRYSAMIYCALAS